MVNCINEALLLYKLHLPSVHFVDIFYESVQKACLNIQQGLLKTDPFNLPLVSLVTYVYLIQVFLLTINARIDGGYLLA